jgi:hypothetical protein
MSKENYEITVEVKRETDKAILVDDGDVEVWLPKSQIVERTDLKDGFAELVIPEWLAEEKELA